LARSDDLHHRNTHCAINRKDCTMTTHRTATPASSIKLRELVAALPIVMMIAALRGAFAGNEPAHAGRSVATA
jgi:hypothetical protein